MRYYYIISNTEIENDFQPQELKDEVVEENGYSQNDYPKVILMILSKEKLKCRKIPLMLQYRVLSKERYREKYIHHMLFMYFPFRDEEELKCNNSYSNELNRPSAIEVVTFDRSIVEPYAIIKDAFERLIVDYGNIGQQKIMKHMIN